MHYPQWEYFSLRADYIYEFRANHCLKAVFYRKSDIIKTHFSTPKSQITSDKKYLKGLNVDQEFIIN